MAIRNESRTALEGSVWGTTGNVGMDMAPSRVMNDLDDGSTALAIRRQARLTHDRFFRGSIGQ